MAAGRWSGTGPVSYTHLDVYKRQDLDGNGAADLAGVNGAGQIFYTLDRHTWVNIPGQLTVLNLSLIHI